MIRLAEQGVIPGAFTQDIVRIGPDYARVLLATNRQNRSKSKTMIERYAADMKAGLWQFNGQPIILDAEGNLIDGQHRLEAVILSNVSFLTTVVKGIPRAAQVTVDRGRKRSAGDDLHIKGMKYGNVISATVNLLFEIATGDTGKTSSATLITKFAEENPEIEGICASASRIKLGIIPYAAAFAFIAQRRGRGDMAAKMLDVLTSGVPSYSGDPMHALREKIIKLNQQKGSKSRAVLLELFASAWQAFTQHETRSIIRPIPFANAEGWTVFDMGNDFSTAWRKLAA